MLQKQYEFNTDFGNRKWDIAIKIPKHLEVTLELDKGKIQKNFETHERNTLDC